MSDARPTAAEHAQKDPLQVTRVKIDSLTPDPRNARLHDERNLTAIKRSLAQFGQVEPLVVQASTRLVVGGNGRLEAMRALGWTECDVVLIDADEKQAKALAIALNRTAELAEWDTQRLTTLLQEIEADAVVDLQATGYTGEDVERLMREALPEDELAGEEEAEEALPPDLSEPITQPGDLWHLGEHRLLCGDALNEQDRQTLTGGALCDAAFCDPPFAIYGSSSGVSASVADDKMVAPFFRALALALASSVRVFAHVYVCCDWRSYPTLWAGMRGFLTPQNKLVWDKGRSGLGSNYANSYEEIAYFTLRPVERTMLHTPHKGEHRPVGASNVLRFPRPHGAERQHNAAKPVGLIRHVLELATHEGETVLDLFGGSGSVLIATAGLQGRRCLTMELEPRWCDVIVERWRKATGGSPRREHVERATLSPGQEQTT